MIKKRWILVVFLINLSIVLAQAPTSDLGTTTEYGVCSNPYVNFNFYGYFCRTAYTTTKEACCPEKAINPEDGVNLYNHPLYPNFPKDKTDCENNFFKVRLPLTPNQEVDLNTVYGCEAQGCCFDPFVGCYDEYKSVCTSIENSKFNAAGQCESITADDWWKDNCGTGCCCDTANGVYYYGYSEGKCNRIGGVFDKTVDSQAACNQKCNTQCNDRVDNDNDGCIDLQDASCGNNPISNDEASNSCGNTKCDCGENSIGCPDDCQPDICSDGVDNDGDGCKDYPEDIGCASSNDNDEYDIGCNNNGVCNCGEDIGNCPSDCKIGECNNEIDDDLDGCLDYPEDQGCLYAEYTTESLGQCDPDTIKQRCDIFTQYLDIYNQATYGIFTNCYWSGGVYGEARSCFNDIYTAIPFPYVTETPGQYQQKCCGDDLFEFYSYFNTYISDGSDADPCDQPGGCDGTNYLDDVCCYNFGFYECPFNGDCYMSEDVFNPGERIAAVAKIDGQDSMGDAICIATVNHPYASWIDCDYTDTVNGINYCDLCNQNSIDAGKSDRYYYTTAGEPSVGEYNDLATPECCGDDDYENYDICKTATAGLPVNWPCVATDDACCNSNYECVKNGICYASQQNGLGFIALPEYIYDNLNPGGNDNKAFCGDNLGEWIDCDFYNDIFFGGVICDTNTCGDPSGVLCGEADCSTGTGEYTDKTKPACCGDDANEYYKCNAADPSICKCCNSNIDTVDSSGNCI